MDQATRERIVGVVLKVIVPLLIGGLAMIANLTLGCFIVTMCVAAIWSLAIWVGSERFELLARKRVQYGGYATVAFGAMVLPFLVRAGKPEVPKGAAQAVPTAQPVTATAQNSPGATVVAIGEANNVTVNPIDSQKLDGMDRKLEKLGALISGLSGSVMWRLDQEYPLGYVLIAFSGEVKKVLPRSDVVEGDWEGLKVHKAKGDHSKIGIFIPYLRDVRSPGQTLDSVILGLDARPGFKGIAMNLRTIRIWAECLKTEPVGICAVLGFTDSTVPPR